MNVKRKAILYIVVAGVLWGTSGIFFNLLKPMGYTPIQMTAMRGVVAAFFMIAYAVIKNKKLFKISLKELVFFGLSGLSIFGTAVSYFASIEASTVSTAVVLMYTAPVFVAFYSVLFFKEKMTVIKLVCISFIILGSIFVSGVLTDMVFSLWGVLLGLLAGVMYSIYNIFAKYEMMMDMNPVSASMYSFIFMGALAFAFCNPVSFVNITAENPIKAIPLIIGIGVVTCVIPYFLYTSSMKHLPAGTVSALGIIEPMSATIISVMFLNEKLSLIPATGIVLILVSVFVLSKNGDE